MSISLHSTRGGSRRRRGRRSRRTKGWAWIALLAVGLGGAGWFVLGSERTTPQQSHAHNGPDQPHATPGPEPAPDESSPQSTAELPLLAELDYDAAPQPGPSMAMASDSQARQRDSDAPSRDRDATSRDAYRDQLRQGMDLITNGDYVQGRAVLSRLLFNRYDELTASDAQTIRDTLDSLNREMVFSPEVYDDDPVASRYRVESGDLLGAIARRHEVPYMFLERINRMDARQLQVGQNIKVINGPIHARVTKSDFRMDLYVNDDGEPHYLASFRVGLGEDDSTPTGRWVITPGRKVTNPDWRNPRTGEYYASDDPDNPIGDYWLALTGLDPENEDMTSYGIHGTIEPDSIGEQRSMGCIRLGDDEIELAYQMFFEGRSEVEVLP